MDNFVHEMVIVVLSAIGSTLSCNMWQQALAKDVMQRTTSAQWMKWMHAFPLPQLGKISSNPIEEANLGLLNIRKFSPFKILVEMWYYLQKKFNLRWVATLRLQDILTEPTLLHHEETCKLLVNGTSLMMEQKRQRSRDYGPASWLPSLVGAQANMQLFWVGRHLVVLPTHYGMGRPWQQRLR